MSCSEEELPDSTAGIDCIVNEAQSNLIEEFSLYAHRFDNTDPEISDKKLENLIDYLGSARIVGLGEGTHGTKEFFDLKHKIFRSLVLTKNFKAIVFEIPWGNAYVVNEFVVNNIGSADEAVDQTWYWTYDTEEVRALVRWMNLYNQDKSEEDKIHFVGCDPQGSNFNIEAALVREYILSVFPDSMFFISSAYQNLPNTLSDYSNADPFIQDFNIKGAQKVIDLLNEQKEMFILNTDITEYEVIKMAAHVIKERERIYRTRNFGGARDSLMAHYALWWSEIYAEAGPIATWAHNLHVMDGGSFNSALMGTVLKDELDDDYINVGFSFGKGSFNAFLADRNRNAIGGTRNQTLDDYACGTTNFLTSQISGDYHYFIFDEISGSAANYFRTPNPFLQCGAGFNPAFVFNYIQDFPLSLSLDVLIHVDETTASELR